jgi:hypothetical protein
MAVTGHGYGHLSLCASVAEALRGARPDTEVTIQCALDPSPFFPPGSVVHEADSLDFGYVMHDARSIDRPASVARYLALHGDWAATMERVRAVMARHQPDVVLACSGYLAVEAAHGLGLPVLGLGPLNWLDIGHHVFSGDPAMEPVLADIAASYAKADGWILPTPSMPQKAMPRHIPVGVISRPGRRDRDGLARALGLDPGNPMALVNFGGLPSGLDARHWAREPGDWSLLAFAPSDSEGAILTDARRSGWGFRDILASVDAVVGKAGYGMVADCAAAGVPMLLVERPDWPEAPHLERWFQAVGRCRFLDEAALAKGDIGVELDALRALGPFPAHPATGGREAAEQLLALAAGISPEGRVRRP